ncbi:hypothetical protein EC968_002015 [Mortierella alpina]|nr:hypothetical protein EC968_002015 [Mortierella alpina]
MRLSKSLLLSATLVAVLSVAATTRPLGPKTELKRRSPDIIQPSNEEDYEDYVNENPSNEKKASAAAPPMTLKPRDDTPGSDKVFDENNFCLLYPTDDSINSLDVRWNDAEACCTGPKTQTWSSCRIPNGLLLTTRYVRSANKYVEISGKVNVTMIGTHNTDAGLGYSDDTLLRNVCERGSQRYITFLEPDNDGFFMVRCCQNITYCPNDDSTFRNGSKAFFEAQIQDNYPDL